MKKRPYEKSYNNATLLILACMLTIFLLVIASCAGFRESKSDKEENSEWDSYESMNLEFTIDYPSDWFIFETSESLLLTSNIDNLVLPPEDRLNKEGDFLVTMYVVDDENVHDFVEILNNNFLTKKYEEEDILLENLLPLKSVIKKEAEEEIFDLYQIIFENDLPEEASIVLWEKGVVLGNTQNLAQSSDIKNFPLIQNEDIKYLDLIIILENNIEVLMKIAYNKSINSDIINYIITMCKSISTVNKEFIE